MAYGEFAYWYDELNAEANYDTLCDAIVLYLRQYGITDGIVADLGCGTGELSIRLAQMGYDIIGVDGSPEMLSVFRQKIPEELEKAILLLQQNLSCLDLFGTIRAAVSSFDTFNHLDNKQLEAAFEKISLFMEPGGLLLFDANTPLKHHSVLADNSFEMQAQGYTLFWENEIDISTGTVRLFLQGEQNGEVVFEEEFSEYCYTLDYWKTLLDKNKFTLLHVLDGDTFAPLTSESQRFFLVSQKKG